MNKHDILILQNTALVLTALAAVMEDTTGRCEAEKLAADVSRIAREAELTQRGHAATKG